MRVISFQLVFRRSLCEWTRWWGGDRFDLFGVQLAIDAVTTKSNHLFFCTGNSWTTIAIRSSIEPRTPSAGQFFVFLDSQFTRSIAINLVIGGEFFTILGLRNFSSSYDSLNGAIFCSLSVSKIRIRRRPYRHEEKYKNLSLHIFIILPLPVLHYSIH